MKLSQSAQTALNRLCYLMPALCGLIALVLACTPRFFYQSGGEAFDTMSLLQLMDNTYQNCVTFLRGSANGSVSALYFSYIMMIFWALAWLCTVFYGVFAFATLLCSITVWTPNTPGSPAINTLKRCYRMLVPNRVFYVIWCFLPILPSFFPFILQAFYQSVLKETAIAHYFGIPDQITVLLLCASSAAFFLLTRSSQRDLRMDLFRLYKAERS